MKEKQTKKAIDPMRFIIPMLLGMIVILLIVLLFVALNKKENKTLNSNSSNHYQDLVEDHDNHDIQSNDTYISKEEALNIALKNAKLERNNIYDISVEFDYKYGKTVYEIDFDYQKYEYEYYIDATNGDILHHFKEWN